MSNSHSRINTNRRSGLAPLWLALVGIVVLGGCATSGDVSDLNSRLDSIDASLADLNARLDETEARSIAAEESAADAERRAAAAAAQAEMAAQKAAAAFDKTVNK